MFGQNKLPTNLKQAVKYLDKDCSNRVKNEIKTIHENSLIYSVYHGLTKLLKDNLPKGKEFEHVRRIVCVEKNVLINRGAKKDEKWYSRK